MSLKTRLDGRSDDNSSFEIKNKHGDTLAVVKLLDNSSTTLQVTTQVELYIEKPNGWTSQQRN